MKAPRTAIYLSIGWGETSGCGLVSSGTRFGADDPGMIRNLTNTTTAGGNISDLGTYVARDLTLILMQERKTGN